MSKILNLAIKLNVWCQVVFYVLKMDLAMFWINGKLNVIYSDGNDRQMIIEAQFL